MSTQEPGPDRGRVDRHRGPRNYHEAAAARPVHHVPAGQHAPLVRQADRAWSDGRTEWFTVKVLAQRRAATSRASLRKGDPVIVQGRLSTEEWVGADGRRARRSCWTRSRSVPTWRSAQPLRADGAARRAATPATADEPTDVDAASRSPTGAPDDPAATWRRTARRRARAQEAGVDESACAVGTR